jgi:hypothetical protein
VSALVKRGSGPALQLEVGSNQPPLKVDSDKMVRNLNADELDGMHASQLAPRGYAQVTTSSPFIAPGSSKGVIGIQRTDAPGNVYCFNLSFTPKAVVASANINNNATVGTAVGANNVPSACASLGTAQEYTTSAHHNDIDFGIVFMWRAPRSRARGGAGFRPFALVLWPCSFDLLGEPSGYVELDLP